MPKVSLLATCLVDSFAPRVGIAAVGLLEAAGFTVDVPLAQTCCGQPAFNSGYPDDAARLARHTLDVFEDAEALVVPSGSCAAMLRRHYTELFRDSPALHARAAALRSRTYELTEFLVDVAGFDPSPLERRDAEPRKIALHRSCHLLRDLGVTDAPARLLGSLSSLEVVDPPDWEICCGFGGTFSVKHPEISVAMADDKLHAVLASGALTVVAADAGCLLHLDGRARREGTDVRTAHVAEVVAEAIGAVP